VSVLCRIFWFLLFLAKQNKKKKVAREEHEKGWWAKGLKKGTALEVAVQVWVRESV
jgi:hypothetical protein